jgi:hypothetical protein
MGIEHLACEQITNGNKDGSIKIERIDDANCFKISKKKFKQICIDEKSLWKSGMREIDSRVKTFEISYSIRPHYVTYDVNCIDNSGKTLREYSL